MLSGPLRKMVHAMKSIVLHLILALLAVHPSFAQEADDEDGSSEPSGRSAWFVYTDLPEGMENPVKVMSNKEIIELKLSKREPSDPVHVAEDGILRIVRLKPNPKDPKKPEYTTIAQTTVSKNVQKCLIILTPIASNPQGLLFQCAPIDLASFKGGSTLYLNMTKSPIRVDLGNTKLHIQPSSSKIYNDPAITQPTNVPIRYSYYKTEKKQWKMLSSSTIVVYPSRREICIFNWDPKLNRIDYHGITVSVM